MYTCVIDFSSESRKSYVLFDFLTPVEFYLRTKVAVLPATIKGQLFNLV